MYLRHTTIKKDGKVHTYWRLVRSVRTGSKVRQETVACLGELDREGRLRAKALAERMLGKLAQGELTGEPPVPMGVATVRLKDVRLERTRRFGDVWLGWTLWRALGLSELFETLLPEGYEDVAWSTTAAITVIARLCEPSSELHIAEDWYRRTAMEDLLGVAADKVNESRLYRVLDKILPHKEALEKHLKEKMGTLFDVRYDLLLYDVTSTYFEGPVETVELAKRGYSRDHRPDCKQVCIALVVTREGLPLGYELFAGNTVDVTTVEDVVLAMEKKYGKADRVWVMDRGMSSEENLEFLRQDNRRYLIGTPKSELRAFEQAIVSKENWNAIREDLEVKLCEGPGGIETFILCRSKSRKAKEEAMHERFIARIEAGLGKLKRRLERSKKPLTASAIERQIGRLLQRNSHSAGAFEITVEATSDSLSGLRVRWQRNTKWAEWASQSEGCYLLRSNIKGWSAEDLWRTYIQLTQAEAAFRAQKTDLSIRPIWHWTEKRVKAHIFVCFLAYVLWKVLEQWQSRAGLGNSPRTLLEELSCIQSADVVLPTQDGHELRLRCVVRPDRTQAHLLGRMGLTLPRRLNVPSEMRNVVPT
jgi:transposase